MATETKEPTKAPAKRGRPKKADIEAKKKGNRGVRGRPKGDAARMNEFKARLLATSGQKVIDKVVEAALTDGHPAQTAAMKMCMDRVLPVSYFEKEKKDGNKAGISITISGVGGTTVIGGNPDESDNTDDEAIEGEYTDVNE